MRAFLVLLLCVFAVSGLALAQNAGAEGLAQKTVIQDFDFTAFEQIPVLENGRVKPIGVYARQHLKAYAGHDNHAVDWLAGALFNPGIAYGARIFQIDDDGLKQQLGLDPAGDVFTLVELQAGLEATFDDVRAVLDASEEDLTPAQRGLVEIHELAISYQELLRSFSLILPLDIDVPRHYWVDDKAPKTYLKLAPQAQKISQHLQRILARKGDDLSRYNSNEKAIALLAFQVQQIQNAGQGNDDFKIIPSDWNGQDDWFAPWTLINAGAGSPQALAYLSLWADMARAYQDGDATAWNIAVHKTRGAAHTFDAVDVMRLRVELFYHMVNPYIWTMVLYGCSILLFFLVASLHGSSTQSRSVKVNRLWGTGVTTGLFALALHAGAILARVYILDRPPVGTLYESVLFVALICAGIGLFTTMRSRNILVPVAGQIAALGLLLIAPVMLQGKDSLELLVAVLNTNFWLATHVIVITAGYGICIVAAVLAHGYLIGRLLGRSVDRLYPLIRNIGLFALLFTAVGTVLGGVWADQSWGRFWGWDPKENGALLIVLWLIWVQHGRLSGHLRDVPYIALMAVLNIIVALAWFGVNLLGVGLHSYGFTSGIATGLFVFCSVELLMIAGLWTAIRVRKA